MDKQRVIEELGLKRFGNLGWYKGDGLVCNICGRGEKFGVRFDKLEGKTHCFYECKTPTLKWYLIGLGRRDLVQDTYTVKSLNFKLQESIKEDKKEEGLPLIECHLPIGFKKYDELEYLDERGFLDEHYDEFVPGYTNVDSRLRDYLLFQIKQKGVLYAYLARSFHSYEWHAKNLKNHKENGERLVLRYKNKSRVPFEKLLGGYDQITKNTKVLYLVEGLFDKVGVDWKLDLFKDETERCCFTFGDSISIHQIELILEHPNIKEVIVLYDFNTVRQIKKASLSLGKYIKTNVVQIKENYDPGDIPKEKLKKLINSKVEAFTFFKNRL